MILKTVCTACGADNAPDGSRFCPNCGSSLLHHNDDEVPMAAATPLADNTTVQATSVVSVEASTVTFDGGEGPPVAAAAADATNPPPPRNPSSSCHCGEPAYNNPDVHYPNDKDLHHGANYFLNPTPDMLERAANSQAMGGILFIETSGHLKGKFTVAKEIGVGRILGGNRIDLSYADFVHPVTTITVGAVLGGIKVIVPRGVRVESRGIGILGGFKGLRGQTVHAAQEAPLVIVQGLAILGGVKVHLSEDAPALRTIK